MEYLEEVRRIYKIVPITIFNNVECDTYLDENDINFVLLFKGTGKSMLFKDILIEWHTLFGQSILDILDEIESKEEMCTLVEFIVKRNYQIIFEPDDIMLVNKHKAA